MPEMSNQFSIQLSKEEASALEKKLTAAGFRPFKREFAQYGYENDSVSAAFYPKRGKLLIQGKGAEDFVRNILQLSPEQKAPAIQTTLPALIDTTPHFGVDESGKGDYFGPLVIAGVYTDEHCAAELARIGCRDSKAIPDDGRIHTIARKIMKTAGVVYEIVCIGPRRYNELYTEFGNLNRLLAWGHARVIAALHEKVPTCPRALSDQFANEWVLRQALGQRRIPVQLEQRTKAESDIAVAAASILARDRFVQWVQQASAASQCPMPLGCAPHVTRAAQHFVNTHGRERLQDIAKLHFKVTQKLK